VVAVLATAPLSQQGRVEVPELLAVADHLRQRGPVLDLQQAFTAVERAALLSGGVDVLDAWGHEELARLLYEALRVGPWLPSRTAAEARAREQVDVLADWAAVREQPIRATAREVLEAGLAAQGGGEAPAAEGSEPLPDGPRLREATRLAALALLLDGPEPAVRDLWPGVPTGGTPPEVPALALGRRLCGLSPGDGATIRDPVERECLALFDLLEDPGRGGEAWSAAQEIVARHPQRLEAWLALEAAMLMEGPPTDVRSRALATCARFERPPAALRRWELLLDAWPDSLRALPALLLASRPEAFLRPRGPELTEARRAAQRGLYELAARLLEQAGRERPVPPSWREARQLFAERHR
jgi:hypothetical protein